MSDPTSWTVPDVLAGYRNQSLSPVEVMATTLKRIADLNPHYRAVAHVFADRAMEQAHTAEHLYRTDPDAARPLEGIPVLVKEDEAIRDDPWTQGSTIYRSLVADHTAPFVQRILDAGGIIHGRSAAPEFSSAAFTQSTLWGVTTNPWNPQYSSGGSSGGSAVALATGMTLLATGSDLAGSIRTPSSFNGTVGYKPPHGRVPVDAPFNLDRYCHCGPMARTVADCLTLQRIIAGPHPDDLVSQLPPPPSAAPSQWRVGVITGQDWPVDPEIADNTRALGQALAATGISVEEIALPVQRDDVIDAAAIHYDAIFGAVLTHESDQHPDQINPYVPEFARWAAQRRGTRSFLDGLAIEAALQSKIAPLFQRFDALVLPAVATRGFLAGDDYVGHGLEVGGTTLSFYMEALPSILFNVLSAHPALTIRSGFANNDVPTGAQIVGRAYDDNTPFAIALHLQRAATVPTTWPALPTPSSDV